jgi:hypothetical protein
MDTDNSRVQKFNSEGIFLTKWGSEGSGDGQFIESGAIAVDESGNVYVADARNYRVQKFAPDYPAPDSTHGLALNGSFEETPDLAHWTYGGELPVALVNAAIHGEQAVRMGEPVTATLQGPGRAWLYQTMYVRPEWTRPLLTFRYRVFVNDKIDSSDFYVWLTKSNGAWLAEIKRDGYDSPAAPPPGHDLGWRTASYDLSAFKGQTVRLVFENRNLGDESQGILTFLDDVRVVDDGPFWLVTDAPAWTVYPGLAATHSITLAASPTFTPAVDLALEGLPAGVEGDFSANPALPNSTLDVELVAAPSTLLGTYNLTITASANVFSGTATVALLRTAHVSLAVRTAVYLPLAAKH